MTRIDRIGNNVCTLLAVSGIGWIFYWHLLS